MKWVFWTASYLSSAVLEYADDAFKSFYMGFVFLFADQYEGFFLKGLILHIKSSRISLEGLVYREGAH